MTEIKKPDALLIIDDEKSIRITLKKILEREGYYVETAPDFDHAKKNLSSLSFDLFILDIILPNINGIEILRKLREEMDVKTPVVFITGEPNINTAVEALRLGAYDYVEKPVRKHEILKVVKQALTRHRLDQQLRELVFEKESLAELTRMKSQLVKQVISLVLKPLTNGKDQLNGLIEKPLTNPGQVKTLVERIIADFDAVVEKLDQLAMEEELAEKEEEITTQIDALKARLRRLNEV